jgi:hypothetical protein
MGHRTLKNINKEIKKIDGVEKEMMIYEFEEKVIWRTFKEVNEIIKEIQSGLISLTGLNFGDKYEY